MKKPSGRQFRAGRASVVLTAFFAMAAAGCVSSPTPEQMSRTTLETAPADLQLLCANEAAKSRGIDGSKVLPTTSRKLDAKSYQVQLNAAGTAMNCVVDADGNVTSVQPA